MDVFGKLIWVTPFAAALLIAAIRDIRRYEIPNWTVGLVLATGLVVVAQPCGPDWFDAAISAAICLVAGFLLFQAGHVGGGDAKLLAAASVVSSPRDLPMLLLLVGAAGFMLALIVLANSIVRHGGKANLRELRLPYGVAVAAGALAAYGKSITLYC